MTNESVGGVSNESVGAPDDQLCEPGKKGRQMAMTLMKPPLQREKKTTDTDGRHINLPMSVVGRRSNDPQLKYFARETKKKE